MNSERLVELRTARAWGLTPSQFECLPPEDRQEMVALTKYEDGLCPGCGQPVHLSMDYDLRSQWESGPPWRCFSCTALLKNKAEYEDQLDAGALRFGVHLKKH